MDTVFMNSENSKTSDRHRLLLNLSDKINFKRSVNVLSIKKKKKKKKENTWKNIKSHTKIINLKYQLQHRMKNLNYLFNHILYQIFKIIFNIS